MQKEREELQVTLEQQASPVSLALVAEAAFPTPPDLWETLACQDWMENQGHMVLLVPLVRQARVRFRETEENLASLAFLVDLDRKGSPATMED